MEQHDIEHITDDDGNVVSTRYINIPGDLAGHIIDTSTQVLLATVVCGPKGGKFNVRTNVTVEINKNDFLQELATLVAREAEGDAMYGSRISMSVFRSGVTILHYDY